MTEQQIEQIIQKKLRAEMPKIKRKWFLLGGLTALLVPLTIWAASITKPHTFTDGDTLSASKLNENFDTLYAKVNSLDSVPWATSGNDLSLALSGNIGIGTSSPAQKLSVSGKISAHNLGLYCGSTATAYDGLAIGGYAGARTKCAVATGCSSTAHMCSSHELIMSLQYNITLPNGAWFASFHRGDGAGTNMDCSGWSSNSGSAYGSMINSASSPFGSMLACNLNATLACCQ